MMDQTDEQAEAGLAACESAACLRAWNVLLDDMEDRQGVTIPQDQKDDAFGLFQTAYGLGYVHALSASADRLS